HQTEAAPAHPRRPNARPPTVCPPRPAPASTQHRTHEGPHDHPHPGTPRPPPARPTKPPAPRTHSTPPGLTTVHVNTPTQAAARNEPAPEGSDTIEPHDPHPTAGRLTTTGLDPAPAAAKPDKINHTLLDDPLPDADFHISDIPRAATRTPGDNWTATAGTYAIVGYPENQTRHTDIHTLSVIESTLQLQPSRWADPCAAFDGNDLPTPAEAVTTAILDDLCRNEECGEPTSDGESYDEERGSCADRTARAETLEPDNH
ncbi:hypothetical protein, partial [Streptomyces zhihengii]|uniref:hypothetical protein n=1 Tax=Streptomyces zhihengii TaxID=1818004 RepID=UPI0033BA29BA